MQAERIIDVPRMPYGHAVLSIRTQLRCVLSMGCTYLPSYIRIALRAILVYVCVLRTHTSTLCPTGIAMYGAYICTSYVHVWAHASHPHT